MSDQERPLELTQGADGVFGKPRSSARDLWFWVIGIGVIVSIAVLIKGQTAYSFVNDPNGQPYTVHSPLHAVTYGVGAAFLTLLIKSPRARRLVALFAATWVVTGWVLKHRHPSTPEPQDQRFTGYPANDAAEWAKHH